MRAIAILNRDAGTLRTTDLEAYRASFKSAFSTKGHEVDCRIVAGADVVEALEEAAGDKTADALIIAGGDGSVSAAAAIAWRSGLPLGVVPAGTMNLFARAAGIPMDIQAVPAVLADWHIVAADICDADDHPFVHQFSAGMHARMIRLREKMEYRSRLSKIAANVRASLGVMFNPPSFEVVYRVNGERAKMRVSAISVSNNPFGPSPILVSERLDGGHLGLYLAKRLDWRGAMGLAFDILRGRLKENIAVQADLVSEVELHFPKRKRSSRCVLDGELLPLPRTTRIRIHPGELKIFTSKPVAVG